MSPILRLECWVCREALVFVGTASVIATSAELLEQISERNFKLHLFFKKLVIRPLNNRLVLLNLSPVC